MKSTTVATATLLQKIRRRARQLSRETGVPYTTAQDQVAREEGFASWRAASSPARDQNHVSEPDPTGDLPVDPQLPPDFDSTPNDARSDAELDAWWMRPYAVSLPEGGYAVRCLDGGAWDRSTFWGTAPDLAGARVIARRGLQQTQVRRNRAAVLLGHDAYLVSIEEDRPRQPRPVLHTASTAEKASAAVAAWDQLQQHDPAKAATLAEAARDRVAWLPTEEDFVEVESNAYRFMKAHGTRKRKPAFEWLVFLATLLRIAEGKAEFVVEASLAELAHYMGGWVQLHPETIWGLIENLSMPTPDERALVIGVERARAESGLPIPGDGEDLLLAVPLRIHLHPTACERWLKPLEPR